jgi:hypothetical protein
MAQEADASGWFGTGVFMRGCKHAILKAGCSRMKFMGAKRKPDLIDELLEKIEKLSPAERHELVRRAKRLMDVEFQQSPPLQEETPPFELKTELAKDLWTLRQQIIASGEPLLDYEDLQAEIAERRGGIEARGY